MEVIEHDIRGQVCPSTLLIALQEINRHQARLRDGSIELRLLTDNRDCLVTIPESARNMGYAAEVARDGAHYVIEIRRA